MIKEQQNVVLGIVDKIDKIGEDKVITLLEETGIFAAPIFARNFVKSLTEPKNYEGNLARLAFTDGYCRGRDDVKKEYAALAKSFQKEE
jgi:hypothetical protein